MNDFQLYELLKKQQKSQLSKKEEQLLDDWFNGLDPTPEEQVPIPLMKARIWSAINVRVNARLRTGTRTPFPQEKKTGSSRLQWMKVVTAVSIIALLAAMTLYIRSPRTDRRTKPARGTGFYFRTPTVSKTNTSLKTHSAIN